MATLTIKGQTHRPSPESTLQRLQALYHELVSQATELARLEDKIVRQEQWLDSHPKLSPEWGKRHAIYWSTCRRRERIQDRIAAIARECDALVQNLDDQGQQQVKQRIHQWAHLGSAAVYQIVGQIAPFRKLFASVEEMEWLRESYPESDETPRTPDHPWWEDGA